MKKILFATTALVATAGVASAEIALKGSAGAGIASEAGGNADVYSFAKIEIVMTGEADNGLTFGASIDATAGEKYDIGDWEWDGAQSGAFGLGSIFVAYGGAKLTFDHEGIDDLFDDDLDSHDVQFDYAINGISLALTADVNDEGTDGKYSYKLGYSANGVAVSLAGNDITDNMTLDAAYTTGAFTVGLNYGFDDEVTQIRAKYADNGLSVEAKYGTDDAWDLILGYEMNALSLGLLVEGGNGTDDWELTGGYNFGGGLSAVFGAKEDESYYAGLAMSF